MTDPSADQRSREAAVTRNGRDTVRPRGAATPQHRGGARHIDAVEAETETLGAFHGTGRPPTPAVDADRGPQADAARGVDVAPAATRPSGTFELIWVKRLWVGGAAVVVALATLVVSLLIPATFESNADLRITLVGQPGTPVSDAVKGANDLASQYTQDVTSDAVIGPAAVQTGIDASDLRARTTAGTVNGQNILRITVQNADPDVAARQAQSVGDSLSRYAIAQSGTQADLYQRNVQAQLAPLDRQIAQARGDGAAGQTRLSALTDRRAQLVGQAALQGASLIPQVQVANAAAPGVKVAPRPVLYALAALALAFFLAAQTVVLRARRGQRSGAGR